MTSCDFTVVFALGFATRDPIPFYLTFALIGAFGSMPSTMMYSRVVSGWFDETRGAMLGVTAGLDNNGFLLVHKADGAVETILAGGVRPV